ncbi:hypothetical protein AOLI_G00299830 [Acnodon oligacanthus]
MPHRCPVTADANASQPLKNGCFLEADKNFTLLTSCEVLSLSRAASADANLLGDFIAAKLSAAINNLKPGKSPGQDNIHPEFVIHQSDKTSIALPKQNKPTEDPKSYRPISLLCVPYKILERLIHSRTEPMVDPQLPSEQAGFHQSRSTLDQVTLLTQDIEDSFQDNEKAGVVFLDLTATYDNVWHCGLNLKPLRTILERHMVLEDGLNQDMGILADYLQKWHLQLSLGKTVAAAYHLNNWEASRELDVYVGKNRLEFQQAPK